MPRAGRGRPKPLLSSPRTLPARPESIYWLRADGFPDMADKRLLRHLTVLREEAEQQAVPNRKFFAIGNAGDIEGYGETLPLLSWVDDNLSRFVIANAPSTSWGRVSPPPFVYALPNMIIKPRDGIFLVTGAGQDRT